MKIAIVGCGFVAAYYGETLPNHPELHVVAVFDIDYSRAEALSKQFHNVPIAPSFQTILDDPSIELILNLTPPSEHVPVSRAALLAGKHVYSEKPLSLDRQGADELLALATKHNRILAVASCNHLGESMQTLGRLALDKDVLGTPRVIYAEIDDGPIHQLAYHTWRSAAGAPWPAETEFRIGCVWEHATYQVNFLTSIFGPAKSVTSFTSNLVPSKMEDRIPHAELGPDFCVAVIQFRSAVIARLTIGTIARRNRSMTITGDKGTLHVDDIWDYEAPVQYVLSRGSKTDEIHGLKSPFLLITPPATPERAVSENAQNDNDQPISRLKHSTSTGQQGIQIDTVMPTDTPPRVYQSANRMDMCLGLAEVAASIREGRRSRMSADHAFHVYEILQALDDSVAQPGYHEIKSDFVAVEPMPALEMIARECEISW